MIIVDSHCHSGTSWYEPIESLLYHMDANGVDKGVLIQHRGMYDNQYLIECTKRFQDRFEAVVIVDIIKSNAIATLEDWANRGARGIRLAPTDRSPGDDPLAIWRKAAELGLVVSSLGSVDEFADERFVSLVSELSDLTIVIEHLAGVKLDEEQLYTEFNKVLELSNLPNTYIKVGGLGEIGTRPGILGNKSSFDNIPPAIDMAYSKFGPERMMWGSDFPPVSNREGYSNALSAILHHPALKSDTDREWIMGRTALKVFMD